MFYLIDQVNDRTQELHGAAERIRRERSLRAWLADRLADAAALTRSADASPPSIAARPPVPARSEGGAGAPIAATDPPRGRCADGTGLDGRSRPKAA